MLYFEQCGLTSHLGGVGMAQPLDALLFPGPANTASDMHVQSGYPIWNLIANWMAHQYDDQQVITDYSLDPAEWLAAKTFYFQHKAMIDAKIILNQEPIGGSWPMPGPCRT